MKDELKKKLEQLIAKYDFREGCSSSNHMSEIDACSIGFQAAHDLMKKDYDAKVQKLVRQNRDLINWLNRMSELRWEDSSHAPNFKYCVQELNKSLAEFEIEK